MDNPRFKLTRKAALAVMVSSALSSAASAQVARVHFATGQVNATGSDGTVRSLSRGAAVAEGDTVATEQGRAQLQFTDGALVSLQPRTTFRIDEFRFQGKNDGDERGFFSLLRGGLRTITGLIGRDNRASYRVRTSTATIGIRGTEYLAEVTNSLRVAVGGGTIAVTNEAGTFVIEQGQSAFIADQTSTPVITFEKPLLPPPGTTESTPKLAGTATVTASEQPGPLCTDSRTASDCTPLESTPAPETPPPPEIPPPPLLTEVGGVAAFGLDASLFRGKGTAQLNTSNQVVAFTDTSTGASFEQGTTAVKDSFYDGTVGVGRWSEGTFTAKVDRGSGLETMSIPVGANQGLQYAFGAAPTSPMPVTNIATYTQLAATQATSTTGALGLGTLAAGQGTGHPFMAVDFATGKIGLDLAVTFTSAGYRVQTTGGIGGLTSSEVALVGEGANEFRNSSAVPTTGITGVACSGGVTCSADVIGFFSGASGARAGFTYEIDDPSAALKVHGAAAATQSELYLPQMTNIVFAYADSSTFGRSVNAAGTAQVAPSGRVTLFEGSDCCNDVTMNQRTAQFAPGEHGYDGTIGFGRLSSGTATVDGGEGGGFSALSLMASQGLHYVFGALASASPASGIATFTLQGATKATSETGALGLGTFTGALAVDFAIGRVGLDFNVNFGGGNNYHVVSNGGLTDLRSSDVGLFASQFSGSGLATTNQAACSSSCSTAVQGFFAGTGASRAGLGYRIFDTNDRVVGAATFTQAGLTPAPGGGALVGESITVNYAGAHDPATFPSSDAFLHPATLASVDSTGNLYSITESQGFTTLGTALPVLGESGNDGIIGWSRWANGTLGGYQAHAGGTLSGSQSFHNVFGTPTPANDMTALQAGSVTATYTLLGATTPTSNGPGGIGSIANPTLTANFGTGTATFNAAVTMNAVGYNINAAGMPITGSTFGGSSFGYTSGAGCASGCQTTVKGFFAGAMAARAGVAYNIQNGVGDYINGAAALKR